MLGGGCFYLKGLTISIWGYFFLFEGLDHQHVSFLFCFYLKGLTISMLGLCFKILSEGLDYQHFGVFV